MPVIDTEDLQNKQDDLLEQLGLHPAQLGVQRHLLGLVGQNRPDDLLQAGDSTEAMIRDAGGLHANGEASGGPRPLPRPSGTSTMPGISLTHEEGHDIGGPSPATSGVPKLLPRTSASTAPDAHDPLGSIPDVRSSGAAPRPAVLQNRSQFSDAENRFSEKHHFWGGVLKGLDVGASILAPGAMQLVPGTMLNQRTQDARANNTLQAQTQQRQEQATLDKTKAETERLLHPAAKEGLTPEETTIHDLMTGEGGKPRVNPETGKPYSYLEAFTAVKQATQDVKPDKTNPLPKDKALQLNTIWNELLKKHHLPLSPFKEGMSDADAKELAANLNNALGKQQGDTRITVGSGDKGTARLDRSYDRRTKELTDMGNPITQAIGRLGRLQDTLRQGSPQADALVAPELLTVMAGGAGSGLRMNEAEIARVIGGRSKWESLKASINQWSTDPTKANSITPEQRQQIRTLVDEVSRKLLAKQKILDDARDALDGSDDVGEHRRILTDARKKLTAIDEGAGASQPQKYTTPAGAPTATGANGHKIVYDKGRWVDAETGNPI
jgi:hypothetical protein